MVRRGGGALPGPLPCAHLPGGIPARTARVSRDVAPFVLFALSLSEALVLLDRGAP